MTLTKRWKTAEKRLAAYTKALSAADKVLKKAAKKEKKENSLNKFIAVTLIMKKPCQTVRAFLLSLHIK